MVAGRAGQDSDPLRAPRAAALALEHRTRRAGRQGRARFLRSTPRRGDAHDPPGRHHRGHRPKGRIQLDRQRVGSFRPGEGAARELARRRGQSRPGRVLHAHPGGRQAHVRNKGRARKATHLRTRGLCATMAGEKLRRRAARSQPRRPLLDLCDTICTYHASSPCGTPKVRGDAGRAGEHRVRCLESPRQSMHHRRPVLNQPKTGLREPQ
mmetsp:Transcript_61460/g.139133  ORF Transcript_61460/g.139133 Transcript_61460/m.139133 type:complete len:210 (+) Transcript_61460:582-1211(+)